MAIINRSKYIKNFNTFSERKENFNSLLVASYDYFFVSDLVVTTYFISNIDLILYTTTLNYVCTCENNVINEETRYYVCTDKFNKQNTYKFKKRMKSCKNLDTNSICNVLKLLSTRNIDFELAFTGFYRYIADMLISFDKNCFTYKIFVVPYKKLLEFIICNSLSTDFITKNFVTMFFSHLEELCIFFNDFLLVDFFVQCINDMNIADCISNSVLAGNLDHFEMLSALLKTRNETGQTKFDIKKFCNDLMIYHHDFIDLLLKTSDTLQILELYSFLELMQVKSSFSQKFYSRFYDLISNDKILDFKSYCETILNYNDCSKTQTEDKNTVDIDTKVKNRKLIFFEQAPADNLVIYDVNVSCSKEHKEKNVDYNKLNNRETDTKKEDFFDKSCEANINGTDTKNTDSANNHNTGSIDVQSDNDVKFNFISNEAQTDANQASLNENNKETHIKKTVIERLACEIDYSSIVYNAKEVFTVKDLALLKLLTKIQDMQFVTKICDYLTSKNLYKCICFILFTNEDCYVILDALYKIVKRILFLNIETHYEHIINMIKELKTGLTYWGLEYFAREQEKHGKISTLATFCIAIYQDIVMLSENTKNFANDTKKGKIKQAIKEVVHTEKFYTCEIWYQRSIERTKLKCDNTNNEKIENFLENGITEVHLRYLTYIALSELPEASLFLD